MKKLLAMTLALAMSLSLAACGGGAASSTPSASTPDASTSTPDASTGDESTGFAVSSEYGDFTVVEEGKLHMSTNASFPPYEMTTDDGGFEGIDVEVAGVIAEKLGLELVVDDMGFDAAPHRRAERPERHRHGRHHRHGGPSGGHGLLRELCHRRAGGHCQRGLPHPDPGRPEQRRDDRLPGCYHRLYLRLRHSRDGGYGEDHVTAYENGSLAVMALLNGQIDAVIIDNEPAKSYVEANEGLKILDTPWAEEEYAIGVAKGNSDLLSAINAVMDELKTDGTFQSIVDKYITAD